MDPRPSSSQIDASRQGSGRKNRQASGSSVFDDGAIEELGRTYHSYKQGAYLLPNDPEEQDRLDLQHMALTTLLNGRFVWAPIHGPYHQRCHVLDIGTGTGIWASQFARQNPRCTVVGSDLSLIQPRSDVDNCSFIKEDAEADEWTHGSTLFDLIHLRLMFTCFTDIDAVLTNIFRHLKPGGYIEWKDHTPEVLSYDDISRGSAMEAFGRAVTRGLAAIGRDATRVKKLAPLLRAHGFVDVHIVQYQYPIGDWSDDPVLKQTGRWMALNVARGLDSTVKLLMAGGLTENKCHEMADRVIDELESGHVHGFMPFYIVNARKPLNSAT